MVLLCCSRCQCVLLWQSGAGCCLKEQPIISLIGLWIVDFKPKIAVTNMMLVEKCALPLMRSLSGSRPCHFTCLRVQLVIMVTDKLKGQLVLMSTLTNSRIPLLIFPFFLVLHHDSDSARRFSQPISFPATGGAAAQLSIELLCCVNDKELQ